MLTQESVHIKAVWDNEAKVWVAESDDVPGLITESENFEELSQKLKILIPELLEANGMLSKYDKTKKYGILSINRGTFSYLVALFCLNQN
ncbi:MAG TPA: DUF1902 domain-containing protein [Thermodesulfovibrionia bacterium]|nr:DUF1902 domain-containing protein [Thermodesulfovibrionia bacterium]